eukprot:241868-Prymnesium_polylepis.1
MVLSTPEAEAICQKSGMSVTDLFRPYNSFNDLNRAPRTAPPAACADTSRKRGVTDFRSAACGCVACMQSRRRRSASSTASRASSCASSTPRNSSKSRARNDLALR